MTDSIRIVGLNKLFSSPDGGTVAAVKDVNLEIGAGKLVTLLGPSGCGKTTLLRMIAGFEEPSSGDIFFGKKRMNEEPPNTRDTAMVFQSYAVFPHLDVFENVAFGLRLRKLPKAEIEERVNRVLEQTGLSGYARRSPNQLSGGQQQRVALARCIVMEPKVLLFDEPLSNLDAKLREQMRVEIRELQQRVGITSIYVTHDQVEAMSISDEIVVMNAGVVEQLGTPHEIYARPASRFVADFIGKANFVPVKILSGDAVDINGVRIGVREMPDLEAGTTVTAVVRPEAIHLAGDKGDFRGTVRRVMFLGNIAEYLVEIEGLGNWLVDSPNPAEAGLFATGDTVFLTPSPSSIHLLR
ncbi:ABC transporter ATP-binding protein [Aquamicrobium terrae]|uniref:Iron(III) transport system ATP-binding protein n=1 Tax=Aquamicrobium terrae TaxID=1324945 RepID=A0ABV2N4C8_9HYPH